MGSSSSLISGALLDDLILPANLSLGIKILKKMGWKSGQGVGEKIEAENVPETSVGKKVRVNDNVYALTSDNSFVFDCFDIGWLFKLT